jgi:hypothetical protein
MVYLSSSNHYDYDQLLMEGISLSLEAKGHYLLLHNWSSIGLQRPDRELISSTSML